VAHVSANSDTDSLTVSVERVNVLFTVAGKHGRPVTKLTRKDFIVLEDDQPQNITNFTCETNLPLNIALLMDTSGSVVRKLRFEREAAAAFFYSELQPGRDKAAVITFDTVVSLLQDYTDDPSVIASAVKKTIAGGSTSLYDSVQRAARMLASQPGRHVVIILSDGEDNSSHISLDKALELAQRNDVIIYTVSTNALDTIPTDDQKAGDANLRQLATETGGMALFPTKLQDLTQSFSKIGEDLRSQYSLAYGPTNAQHDGTYRQIRVVPSHKKYSVRARNGYFAPPS